LISEQETVICTWTLGLVFFLRAEYESDEEESEEEDDDTERGYDSLGFLVAVVGFLSGGLFLFSPIGHCQRTSCSGEVRL
jgi:hypothetical protein